MLFDLSDEFAGLALVSELEEGLPDPLLFLVLLLSGSPGLFLDLLELEVPTYLAQLPHGYRVHVA